MTSDRLVPWPELTSPTGNGILTANQMVLASAQRQADDFQIEWHLDSLDKAFWSVTMTDLSKEAEPKARAHVREDILAAWLTLFQIVDERLDPRFDESDFPITHVIPPRIPGQDDLRPGADPSRIADPVARAKYEKDLAEYIPKGNRYNRQYRLRQLDRQHFPSLAAFIRKAYTRDPVEQQHLRTTIERMITHPDRKAALLNLLGPSQQ